MRLLKQPSEKPETNNSVNNPISEIIRNKIFMSPLAGITDIPFRITVQQNGCRFSFTEMIDANGLFYNNWKTIKMLELDEMENTSGVQIVGADENALLYAAQLCAERGFGLLELNASCPVKKIVKDGKGAALLKDLNKLGKIVSKLSGKLNIPVSVKIRSGWNDNDINCIKAAKIIEDSGASAICIHSRTRTQMYGGLPDYDLIRSIKKSVKIPVFASGNAFSPQDIVYIMDKTGCDAVAIARGALGRPWIFNDFYSFLLNKKSPKAPEFDKIKGILYTHMMLCDKFYGGRRMFLRMHKNIQWYLKGLKNRHNIVNAYRLVKNLSQFKIFLDALHLDPSGNMYFDSGIANLNKSLSAIIH